jgi:DNA-directed RNA polymerase specialized sigma24 family protein
MGTTADPVPDTSALHAALADEVRRSFSRRGVPDADLDELTQEVFLRVHRARGEFLRGERVDAWVRRIAYNVLVDASRRDRRRPEFSYVRDSIWHVRYAYTDAHLVACHG